jgi:hypothetical protein
LLDVVSEDWAKDKLPEEDILVRKDIHGMLEVDEDSKHAMEFKYQ